MNQDENKLSDKDFRSIKSVGHATYKFTVVLFFLMLLFSCAKSKNKIEGTWTVIKIIETEKPTIEPKGFEKRHLQFLDGEMKLFNDTNRIGLGLYYYKFKGDSLYLTNLEIDSTGKYDTLATRTGLVSFKKDTMIIESADKTYYYKRVETKPIR